MYDYGLIGNCQISALVSRRASIDWLCLPRPDSEPVFGGLLDPEGGRFSIEPEGEFTSESTYLYHTNILQTLFTCHSGGKIRVLDFCPRFVQFGRIFRPISLFRIVEPLSGECRIRVKCDPVQGWRQIHPTPVRGNSHLRWRMAGDSLRLDTSMSITHLLEHSSFTLNRRLYFTLTWGSSLEKDLTRLTEDYFNETEKYWRLWVKHCSIPSRFQEETIRSALTLKLHCFEDTGAILAALTSSLPEVVGGVRNWDYRYCWLRDAYFVLSALNVIGQFEEMEDFLMFLMNVVADHNLAEDGLSPVYALDHQRPGPEVVAENWSGFAGSRPVRIFNQASEHVQNDVYGEMILSLSPIFLDARFAHLRSRESEALLEHLLKLCAKRASCSDAGPWEIRSEWKEHSFSNLACWAGLERGLKLKTELGILQDTSLDFEVELRRVATAISKAIRDQTLRNGPGDDTIDASLLLLPIFRYHDKGLCERTVAHIFSELQLPGSPPGYLYRYKRKDDFGVPRSAFVVCGFWLVQALAKVGRKEEAETVLRHLMTSANSLGLYSEHFDPATHTQTGNFPQAYSHVGLINAAFAVSPPWSDIL